MNIPFLSHLGIELNLIDWRVCARVHKFDKQSALQRHKHSINFETILQLFFSFILVYCMSIVLVIHFFSGRLFFIRIQQSNTINFYAYGSIYGFRFLLDGVSHECDNQMGNSNISDHTYSSFVFPPLYIVSLYCCHRYGCFVWNLSS